MVIGPEKCCLVDVDSRPAHGWQNLYRGRPAFLVCGGPSLRGMDLSPLTERGMLVAACNNVAATHVRPNLWFSVDDCCRFSEAIWRDPAIIKIVKHRWHTRTIYRRADGSDPGKVWEPDPSLLKTYPGIFWLLWKNGFDPNTFLTDPLPTWGCDHKTLLPAPDNQPVHSVMFIALRMLHWLGCRTVYLLGCDFDMPMKSHRYAFDTHECNASALDNSWNYQWLQRRFVELRPHFAEHGYRVVNCTPGGKLEAFERMEFGTAVAEAKRLLEWPREVSVYGLY